MTMKISFEADTEEELELIRVFFANSGKNRPMTNAERCKKYRENKKACVDIMSERVENMSNDTKEERDEKEEDLPLSSPSSLPSSPCTPINYPITPYNPPLPEERAEREEKDFFADVDKTKRIRGELKDYGFYGNVKLTDDEYNKLYEKFGFAKTQSMIENMDYYIGEDPKRQKTYKTRNHYLTLLNWERKDQERISKQPKRESWTEIAEKLQAEIDL